MPKKERDTINSGPPPQRRDRDQEFEIGGNVKARGQNPSPDDRERGERSNAEPAAPIDR